MRRREFLPLALGAFVPAELPVRAITRPPLYHWFGYYDKLQFDPTSRYALSIANNFQHRLPTPDDTVQVGMVDLHNRDKWIDLGESQAWSWHQGCMLQWLPGSRRDVIWNVRVDGQFRARIQNVRSSRHKLLPKAIYCLSPDARYGFVNDFARSFTMRRETGYTGGTDPYDTDPAPAGSGIWRVDLATGRNELIVSLADVVKIPLAAGDWTGSKHYFDHLLVSPDGKHLAFFQRWAKGPGRAFSTRMFTMSTSGGDLRMLDGSGKTSHYNWYDPEHLVAWTFHPSHGNRFYRIHDRTGAFEALAPDHLTVNGHCTFLPGNRWFLSDTYPDKQRQQHVFLFDTETDRKVELGAFHAPAEYTGPWRCDTTPRISPDLRTVIIDSPHAGTGRQMYAIDVSSVITPSAATR